MGTINIVFDGAPGPKSGRFIEVEDDEGVSIKIGEWIEGRDGFWVLRITELPSTPGNTRVWVDENNAD